MSTALLLPRLDPWKWKLVVSPEDTPNGYGIRQFNDLSLDIWGYNTAHHDYNQLVVVTKCCDSWEDAEINRREKGWCCPVCFKVCGIQPRSINGVEVSRLFAARQFDGKIYDRWTKHPLESWIFRWTGLLDYELKVNGKRERKLRAT